MEANARETVSSLAHWTIGLAAAAALVTIVVAVRRRLAPVPPPAPQPPALADGQPHLVERGVVSRRLGVSR